MPQKAPNAAGKNQPPVYTEILVRPIHRGVNDIGTWRSGLRLADQGNRTKLYDLYSDLLVDGYLADAIDKRIDAVTDADLAFTIGGKRVDAIDDLMDTPEFEALLREIMLSRFWGVSLVECLFVNGFEFKPIPRKHTDHCPGANHDHAGRQFISTGAGTHGCAGKEAPGRPAFCRTNAKQAFCPVIGKTRLSGCWR